MPLRYRRDGHWSRDGTAWIVGDGMGARFSAQDSLVSQFKDASPGAHAGRAQEEEEHQGAVATAVASGLEEAKEAKMARLKKELAALEGHTESSHSSRGAGRNTNTAGAKNDAANAHVDKQQEVDDVGGQLSGTKAGASQPKMLSAGPLSLKRLLKDLRPYEQAMSSFFGDKTQPHTGVHFTAART